MPFGCRDCGLSVLSLGCLDRQITIQGGIIYEQHSGKRSHQSRAIYGALFRARLLRCDPDRVCADFLAGARDAPGIMVGAYFVTTTSVSEFLTAMGRLHVSEKVLIPLAVIFRFFPTMGEEYCAIRDAMRMRGIRLGRVGPEALFTYRVVPLVIQIVKIGDELAAAALARGLGAPVVRTRAKHVGFGGWDVLALALCVGSFVVFLCAR